jgi:hypothetical protein
MPACGHNRAQTAILGAGPPRGSPQLRDNGALPPLQLAWAISAARQVDLDYSKSPRVTLGELDGALGGFTQTEMWLRLSLVNGVRFQSAHRSRRFRPASRAMRSSSQGHA